MSRDRSAPAPMHDPIAGRCGTPSGHAALVPRRRGRPAQNWLSVEQVAVLLDAEPAHIAQACAPPVSFFPGAIQRAGTWQIPQQVADQIAAGVGTVPVPLLTLRRFAQLVDLSYQAAYKAAQRGTIRTVDAFGGLRVPVSEYWRAIAGTTPRPFLFSKSEAKA